MNVKVNKLMINEIKDEALRLYTQDAPDMRNMESFLAQCYIKSTINYLERNNVINKVDVENTNITYSVVEEG
jgi:hypothetical protein